MQITERFSYNTISTPTMTRVAFKRVINGTKYEFLQYFSSHGEVDGIWVRRIEDDGLSILVHEI